MVEEVSLELQEDQAPNNREKLVREQGAGSGEQGFHLQMIRNSGDHGKADLLPWIINVWTFIKYWR
jgi:hypothetical protein